MTSLKGHLLIADASLLDPMFGRSVILLIDHDKSGAMGVILNVPTGTTMTDLAGKLFEEGYSWDKPLNLGGPVPGPLVVLHEIEALSDREVVPGVYATLNAVKAQEVASRNAEPSLILANHSAWGPGQLESEFGWGHWHVLPATAEVAFWRGDANVWEFTKKRVNTHKLTEILKLRGMPSDPRRN